MTTQPPESDGPLGTTLRVGTIRSCRLNEDARPPAYVLEIDLGPHGHVASSARI
ncbi:MAG: tRNA-binding protein, partial [Phycisphaeraceae bacterium]|nr:tRNA-binding protein [Phycisphaeraceae bacterium]